VVHSPSSKLVPAMKGTRANIPRLRSLEGRSGKNPPGPSSVGLYGVDSVASSIDASNPCKIDDVPAVFRQSKVLLVLATEAHSGTLDTKSVQTLSRTSAACSRVVAADPDSNILFIHPLDFLKKLTVKRGPNLLLLELI